MGWKAQLGRLSLGEGPCCRKRSLSSLSWLSKQIMESHLLGILILLHHVISLIDVIGLFTMMFVDWLLSTNFALSGFPMSRRSHEQASCSLLVLKRFHGSSRPLYNKSMFIPYRDFCNKCASMENFL